MDGFFNSEVDGPHSANGSSQQQSVSTQGGESPGADGSAYGARALSKSRCEELHHPPSSMNPGPHIVTGARHSTIGLSVSLECLSVFLRCGVTQSGSNLGTSTGDPGL